jgi:hypothetical protein
MPWASSFGCDTEFHAFLLICAHAFFFLELLLRRLGLYGVTDTINDY